MKVAIIKDEALDYCRDAPFHPPEKYPEYPFNDTCNDNGCYRQVRDLLYKLGMDREHYGLPSWNPLGDIIRPGDNVFIKPNFVSHFNRVGGIEAIITQGAVIRPMVDYACIALKNTGSITIGDAPYINADFDHIVRQTGVDRIAEYYAHNGTIKVNIIDLRKEKGDIKLGRIKRVSLPGDPLGYSVADLKKDSAHYGVDGDQERYRVVYYDRNEMARHHTKTKNEYYIANSILNADVVISMPKMKTHGKTGMSCALKNLIGINGLKDWLPHHKAGPADAGGDEYLRKDLRKDILMRVRDEIPVKNGLLYALPLRALCAMIFVSGKVIPFRDPFEGGSWHGNETLPKTIADLNRIMLYADKSGAMRDVQQRKVFIVVDGIVAGEKEGPMSNGAKKCGVLMAGHNPVEVDIACSLAMGFDPRKIHVIRHALGIKKYPVYVGDPRSIEVVSDKCKAIDEVYGAFNCSIVPPKSWIGHIEHEPVTPMASAQAVIMPPIRN